MPVYLDDKDALIETIKKHLKGVNCSVSEFMAYIYMDGQGLYLVDDCNEYDQMIDNIRAEHPTQDAITVIEMITEIMEQEERAYLNDWVINSKGLERLRKIIRGEYLDDYREDCQTGYLSSMC
jgi:hypothetical protein